MNRTTGCVEGYCLSETTPLVPISAQLIGGSTTGTGQNKRYPPVLLAVKRMYVAKKAGAHLIQKIVQYRKIDKRLSRD